MLKGKFVALRAIEEEDLPQLVAWRNNPAMRKYFREIYEINRANQKKWFESINEKDSRNKMFAITDVNTGELLGACGFCYIDWVNRSADFSIYIGYQDLYMDDHYAIDAGNVMRDYGFGVLNLHRLWTEIYSIDTIKQSYFQKMGFSLDGIHPHTYWYNNTWHNSHFYSCLNTVPDTTRSVHSSHTVA